MKKLSLLVMLTLLMSACSPDIQEPIIEVEAPSITWESTNFLREVDKEVQNVTDILIATDGRVFASFYDDLHISYIAMSEDEGKNWETNELLGIKNPRVLRQLSDGTFILGATGLSDFPLLYVSDDGLIWEELVTHGEVLPNDFASSVWDILQLSDGSLLIATDNANNDPDNKNPSIYRLEEDTLTVVAEFNGIGVLSLEVDLVGNIYAATQESGEHSDAEIAGQARIYKSIDNGETWIEKEAPDGANRIYDILAASDGSIYLGSGLLGEFYRSTDRGTTWEKMTHVPAIEKSWGDPPRMTPMEASRVYQIIELSNGMILVGTGNKTGNIFLTENGGESWIETSDTGDNIVTWGLAQDPKTGLLWAGTGSFGGDVFTAVVE